MERKNLKEFYEQLSKIDEKVESTRSDWATGEGIYQCLNNIFEDGDIAHVIHPNLSSKNSPANSDIGIDNYIEVIDKIVSKDGGILKNPIISIWNTGTNQNTTGYYNAGLEGSHWQTMVILPKNYLLLNNCSLNNSNNEIVFFQDSLNPNIKLSDNFKNLFKESKIIKQVEDEEELKITLNPFINIGGKLPDALFVDPTVVKQQTDKFNCGFFAVYNACMFIKDGNGDFIKKNINAKKLRSIFINKFDLVIEENNNRFLQNTFAKGNFQNLNSIYSSPSNISPMNIKSENDLSFSVSSVFEESVLFGTYVDKTYFIKEIIECTRNSILILRPRRWGKTFNMHMLYIFIKTEGENILKYHNGKYDLSTNNKYAPLFFGGKYEYTYQNEEKTFTTNALYIGNDQNKTKFIKYQGKYPTIFISFKDCKKLTFKSILNDFCNIISELFQEHEYLYEKITNNIQKNTFEKYSNPNLKKNVSEIESSLKFLSQMLFLHFGNKKVYVLIDEYDTPINNLIQKKLENKLLNSNIVEKVSSLINGMLSKVGKDNYYCEKLVMTGILDSLQKELSSGLNTFGKFDFSSNYFTTCFGFQVSEIKQLISNMLIQKQGIESETNLLSLIKYWYNGYNVNSVELYNPWSVLCYLADIFQKKSLVIPKSYWTNSGVNVILKSMLKNVDLKELTIKFKFDEILQNKEVDLSFKNQLNLLEEIKNERTSEETFTYLLYYNGYLTQNLNNSKFRIPNFEVQQEFESDILGSFKNEKGFKLLYNPLVESLVKLDFAKFKSSIKDFMSEMFSSLDVSSNNTYPEKSYQMFLLGIFASLKNTHRIKSELRTISGTRIDIAILSNEIAIEALAEGISFIIEIKRAEKADEDLKKLAQVAIDQINNNGYCNAFLSHNKNKVIVGIAFKGKNDVEIIYQNEISEKYNSQIEWDYISKFCNDNNKIENTILNKITNPYSKFETNLQVNLPQCSNKSSNILESRKTCSVNKIDGLNLPFSGENKSLKEKLAFLGKKRRNIKDSFEGIAELLSNKSFKNHFDKFEFIKSKLIQLYNLGQSGHLNNLVNKIIKIFDEHTNNNLNKTLNEIQQNSNEDNINIADISIINNINNPRFLKKYEAKYDMIDYDNLNNIDDQDDSYEPSSGNFPTNEGMLNIDIEFNLKLISNSLLKTKINEIMIKTDVVHSSAVIKNFQSWINENPNCQQLIMIVTLSSKNNMKHAILFHAKKAKNKINVKLIDPLKITVSNYIADINEIALKLKKLCKVRIIYSGMQNYNYSTCADMCLIRVRKIIQTSLDKYKVNNAI